MWPYQHYLSHITLNGLISPHPHQAAVTTATATPRGDAGFGTLPDGGVPYVNTELWNAEADEGNELCQTRGKRETVLCNESAFFVRGFEPIYGSPHIEMGQDEFCRTPLWPLCPEY